MSDKKPESADEFLNGVREWWSILDPALREAVREIVKDEPPPKRKKRTQPDYSYLMPKWPAAPVDAFAALGLGPTATAKQIKAAHNKLVQTVHPDKGGDAAQFIKVQEAYNTALAWANRRKHNQ